MKPERVCALIVAAGRGVRFGATENKVFAPLAGRPLLGWTLAAFANAPVIEDIVIVGTDEERARLRSIADAYGGGKVREIVAGGQDRQASVYNGLQSHTARESSFIAIHDAARCCITPCLIETAVIAGRIFGATTAALPVSDTLVHGAPSLLFGDDVPRDGLYAVQTPQVFARDIILSAHEAALRDDLRGTDDAGLVRRLGGSGHHVPGSSENLKVTRPEDLCLAEAILLRREALTPPAPLSHGVGEGEADAAEASPLAAPNTYLTPPSPTPWERGAGGVRATLPFRIGHGYDVHAFTDNRPLYLGGVHFPDSSRGMEAHSDGDVILHALCDALLGAAGLGDIGKLFPPSDDRHKDRPSLEFLREVADRLTMDGWQVGNVDLTVLAEFPKIGPRAGDMKREIGVVLGILPELVSIKATTNEGMGFVGRGEGIAVHATALIYR